MTFPTLPTRWGEILTFAGLTFGLTDTFVKGAKAEKCGSSTLCGYGTRCDIKTTQCVSLSDNGDMRKREGNPNSLFYCLGQGVTECGDQLCGYRAECHTGKSGCRCSFNNGVLIELKGTSPSLWYCVESCSSGSSCNGNTACTEIFNTNMYRCNCLPGAALSPTGQCLGGSITTVWASATNVITHTPSPFQGDDSLALTIALATGIGGVLLVAGIILVVVILARRRKRKRANDSELARLRRHDSSRTPSRNTQQSMVDPSLPGQSGMDNPAGPTATVRTEIPVINPSSPPGTHEDVDNDFPVIYSTAKVTDKWNKNKANQGQEANNAISPPTQPSHKAEPENVNDLYSNHIMPFNETQQRKNDGSSENMENQIHLV